MKRHALLAPFLVVLTACPASEPPDVTAAKAEVEAATRKWHELYDNGDVDGVAAMLHAEVSMPVPPDQFLHGREAVLERIKKEIEDYVISKNFQGKRKTRFGPIRVTASGELGVARYDVTITDPAATSTGLFTRVFRRDGGQWLVVLEHYTITPLGSTLPKKE